MEKDEGSENFRGTVRRSPAGLAAVDLSNPQSWNRYAYVLNNPLALIDPTGLVCSGVDETMWDTLSNGTGIFTQDDCIANGGTWAGGGQSGGCTLDGADISCGLVSNLADAGATALCVSANCSVTVPLQPVITGSGFYTGTLALPGFATTAYPCPNGDCRVSPPMIEVDPTVKFMVNITVADSSSGGGSSIFDARANALAHAISKTRVQAIANPCTVLGFYAVSAGLGGLANLAAGGQVASWAGDTLSTNWPSMYHGIFRWLYNNSLTHGPGLAVLIAGAKQGAQQAANFACGGS